MVYPDRKYFTFLKIKRVDLQSNPQKECDQ